MNETRKDIRGYEDYYQISDMGNGRSLTRTVTMKNNVKRTYEGRMLNSQFNPLTKHYNFNLSRDGETKSFHIWALVLEHFTDFKFKKEFNFERNDFDGEIVFLNLKRKDCRLSNLKFLKGERAGGHRIWKMLFWEIAESYDERGLVRMYSYDGLWFYPCGRTYDAKEDRGREDCKCKIYLEN